MMADDRPRYPMTFIVQLEFSGCVQRPALEAAIEEALERHPLLTAIIGPGKQNKDCWLKAPHLTPEIHWGALSDPIEFSQGEFLDLRTEVGLRIFVRHNDERTVLTCQFHHSSCDGIGSYQFLGDVLYYYAIRTGDDETQSPAELPVKRLKDRGRASYDVNNFRLEDGSYQRTWDEALKILLRPNIVLPAPSKKGTEFQRPFPGIESYVFDKAEYKQLRLAAQKQGQIINDLLVEKLFETLHVWNSKYRTWPLRRQVCIMMPLNLRESGDQDISACNIVAHAFVRRNHASLSDTGKFRADLAHELLQIKHDRHKIRFMHMLAGGHYFYPKIMKASLDFKRNMATAILSNTGDPTRQFLADLPREKGAVRCGNLLLEDVSGVPPLRPGTAATISIFTYRRVLKICLRCDPNQFSTDDTRALLELYVENMKSTLAES